MSNDCKVTMTNSNDDESMEDYNKKSLMEKWRHRTQNTVAHERRKKRIQNITRVLITLHGPSQIYIFIAYVIPYLWFDYDPWAVYWIKVLFTYVNLMAYINYFMTILYSSAFGKSRDRPYSRRARFLERDAPETFPSMWLDKKSDDSTVHGEELMDTLASPDDWTYCDQCRQYIPPRAFHCNECKTCILKRDHHCYIVGTCIGYKNQRCFVMCTFYGMLSGLLGYFYFKYIYLLYFPNRYSFLDFVLPVTLYRWLFGTSLHLSFHLVVMIAQVHIQCLFAFAGFVYFNSQMVIISQDKTLYEIAKKVPITSANSLNANFRSVFGDFWPLNFLFPMQIVFRQPRDGTSWPGVTFGDKGVKHK